MWRVDFIYPLTQAHYSEKVSGIEASEIELAYDLIQGKRCENGGMRVMNYKKLNHIHPEP